VTRPENECWRLSAHCSSSCALFLLDEAAAGGGCDCWTVAGGGCDCWTVARGGCDCWTVAGGGCDCCTVAGGGRVVVVCAAATGMSGMRRDAGVGADVFMPGLVYTIPRSGFGAS
jgi:hypothetical protein